MTAIKVAEVGPNFVWWTWNPVEGATGYQARARLYGADDWNPSVYTEEPSFRLDGLEPGTGVTLRIRAMRDTAGGRVGWPWSEPVHADTLPPPPGECTDERERAIAYGTHRGSEVILLGEWDGTPFRFYFDAAIPESERADAQHFFAVVERLSERIEDRIGYSILEVAGWISPEDRGFEIRDDVEDCEGARPAGIVATVIPDTRASGRAVPHCAVMYWANNDIDTKLDGTMAHELFHLFGFKHSLETHPHDHPPEVGVAMSARLTNQFLSSTDLGVTFEDLDALRCIFRKGG